MNCLNEYKLEYLFHKPDGLKGIFWRRHLKKCINCQENLKEIRENNNFMNAFKIKEKE